MKRFTKMLALGMAMALSFGMTVSATGNDVNSPVAGISVNTPEGITSTPVTDAVQDNEVYEATNSAWLGGALNGFGTDMSATYMGAFDLDVAKAGKITINLPILGKDYGYGYGYVLFHFKDWTFGGKPEVIPMSETEVKGVYAANVKSGSPYALVRWNLDMHDSFAVKGGRATYQDQHTAARKAIEVDGIGDTVAQEYKNKDYKFYQTMDSVVLNLAEDSTVEFPLANIDGNYGYVVLCYNDMQNIAGYPSRHFELTKTAENTYSGKLPKGEYVAVVIKVTNVPGSAPAPTTPVDTNVTAPNLQGGAQAPAAGVVSPKTGEALPMAVVLAAICLAGAAVCAKKARCNG